MVIIRKKYEKEKAELEHIKTKANKQTKADNLHVRKMKIYFNI